MEQEKIFELKTWDDVDACLREIAESEITLNDIEGNMNLAIHEAKENAEKLAKPMKARIEALNKLAKAFAEAHKDEIEGKTKALTHGKIGFRASSRVSVPTKTLDQVLQALKKNNMGDCITVKETVNKEVLEKYSDKDIAKVGASRKYEDKFWLETDKEKVRR